MTALFDRWYMLLVRYGLRTTANYELAEDLAQDALMQLYQALRAGKEIQHPKAWTICVLRRNMYKQIKDRNLQEQLDETDIPGEVVTETLKLGEIRDLLSVLSPREEEVLLLRLDALKYREIADQLGISMNSVNALLARALRKLQVAMLEKTKVERENRNANQPATRAS
ncbi:MAG: RNA polymerase sigma factor [Terracidiphilus sp.]